VTERRRERRVTGVQAAGGGDDRTKRGENLSEKGRARDTLEAPQLQSDELSYLSVVLCQV